MKLLERVDEDIMLGAYRKASKRKPSGYKTRTGIWTGLPRCRWWRAELTWEELGRVSLIRNELNWLALGGYLREPSSAAAWFNAHAEQFPEMRDYANELEEQWPEFPPILVGPPDPVPSELVILDGNHRVTAWMMSDHESLVFPVVLGTHNDIENWAFYRDGKRIRKTLNEVGW